MKPERIQNDVLEILELSSINDPETRARIRELVAGGASVALMAGVVEHPEDAPEAASGSLCSPGLSGLSGPVGVSFEGVIATTEDPVFPGLVWALARSYVPSWAKPASGSLTIG